MEIDSVLNLILVIVMIIMLFKQYRTDQRIEEQELRTSSLLIDILLKMETQKEGTKCTEHHT